MPPKGKGGGATRKIFDKAAQNLLNNKLAEEYDGNPCLRCGLCVHHHTLDCWDQFKPQQHWSKGAWNYENKEAKRTLEAYFQVEQKKRVDSGNFKTKFKKEPALKPEASTNPGDASAKIPGPSNLPSRLAAPSLFPVQGSRGQGPPSNAVASSSRPRAQNSASNIAPAAQHAGSSSNNNNQPAIPVNNFPNEQDPDATPVDYKYYKQNSGHKPNLPLGRDVKIYPFGTGGLEHTTSVITNYIALGDFPDTVYVYTITNTHQSTKTDGTTATTVCKKRKELQSIFETARVPHLDSLLQSKTWATNYSTIWTTAPILAVPSAPYTFRIDYVAYGGHLKKDMTIEIKSTTILSNFRATLQQRKVHKCGDIIAALNALVTHPVLDSRPDFSVTQVDQNRFFINEAFQYLSTARRSLELSLRSVRGYFTSIRPGQNNKFFLNVNTATSTFLPVCRVSDLLHYIGIRNAEVQREVDLGDIGEWLYGVQLRLVYKRPNVANREVDINDEKSRLKTFQGFGSTLQDQRFYDVSNPNDVNGRTVLDYFTNDVQIGSLRPTGLCVNVGKRLNASAANDMREQSKQGAIWIPAQLLEIIPNQPMKLQLPSELISKLTNVACRKPAQNAKLIIEEGLDVLRVDGRSSQALTRPDFIMGKHLLDVPAQFLRAPDLQYRREFGTGTSTQQVRDASWNLTGNFRFQKTESISKVNVFLLDTPLNVRSAVNPRQWVDGSAQLLTDMVSRLKARGITAGEGIVVRGNIDRLKIFLSQQDPKTSATIVILRSKSQIQYAKVKCASDLHHGVRTICAVGSKITHYHEAQFKQAAGFGHQHLDNLALKFNIKAGGQNHHFQNTSAIQAHLGQANQLRDTIVFGADVAHPPVGAVAGYPSIACVVASSDEHLQNYPGSMRLQAGRQELIEDMYGMVLERLEARVQNPANQPRNSVQSRKRIPTSILFYRDGLSESQFQECNDTEIHAVQQAFATLATKYNQPNAQLNLTFIVVGKRHHTRFFPKTESESHGPWNQPAKLNGNVKPGRLVNSVITTPNDFNFYLQSHAAPNGTARPAHYHILRDGMNFGSTNTRLAELTNILCYCFPLALKGVSYAAPAYIADRLCERGRMYLKNWAQPYNYRLPADDNGAAWTETRIKAWKTRKALELSQSADWGHYQHADSANREKRHNPWSKTLDGTMFWM